MSLIKDPKISILQKVSEAKKYSRKWHAEIRKYRSLYDFQHYSGKARKSETRYPDPTYTNTVDLAVGILRANQMDWHAYGWEFDIQEEADTSKIEKYLAGLVHLSLEREEKDIVYNVILNLVRDGAACLYSVWDTKLAKRFKTDITVPSAEDGTGAVTMPAYLEPPIRVQSIDPTFIHLVPGGPKRWLAVARIEKQSVFDIEQRYDVKIHRYSHLTSDQKMTTMDEFIDYWELVEHTGSRMGEEGEIEEEVQAIAPGLQGEDVQATRVRNALIYAGEFVREPKIMDGYEDLPYTVAFFKPVDDHKPEDWGHSILEPMISSVKLLERTINRRARQIDVFSSLPMVSKAQSGRSISIDPAIGQLVKLRPEEDIGFAGWSGNPPDVEEQIGYLRTKVQQSSFSDLAYGSGPSQISGYALSQISDQNRIRLEQPIQHLRLMWVLWARKVLKLTARFASDSYVRSYGRLRGKSFTDQVFGDGIDKYRVDAIIKPKFPNDETRNHAFFTQTKGSLPDRLRYERYLGIEQADDVYDMMISEELRRHPAMQNYTIVKKLQQMAEEEKDDAARIVLQDMMARGLDGRGGRPESVNPDQLSGVPGEFAGTPPEQDVNTELEAAANQGQGF